MKLPLLSFLIVSFLGMTGCNKFTPFLIKGSSTAAASQPGSAALPVIIIAGQSNAVGQGQAYMSPPVAGMAWTGLDYPRGIGPAFTDAYLLKTHRPEAIVIQCAVGGTLIAQWATGGTLNNQCLAFYETVKKANPTAELAVILFWQGEADAGVSTTWAQDFTAIVKGFRTSFNKMVPVVFAQLDPNGAPNAEFVSLMAQQEQVNIPFTAMVKTSDVQMFADYVHVNAAGLEIIGQRIAQAYLGIINE